MIHWCFLWAWGGSSVEHMCEPPSTGWAKCLGLSDGHNVEVDNIYWTQEVAEAIEKGKLEDYYQVGPTCSWVADQREGRGSNSDCFFSVSKQLVSPLQSLL